VTEALAQDTAPRRSSRGWAVVGVLGELLMTLGVVLLLFVVYQLWWTNVAANRAADALSQQLQEQWARPPAPAPDGEADQDGYVEPEFGSAFAMLYIPRLSDSVWATPVVSGVEEAQLAQGIGHYPTTALPGQVGNFAVAGHRATNGEPLRDIDRLQVGDQVYVETRDTWYVYTLERDQIVWPTDTWVIAPVPGEPGAAPTEPLLTITTCHPRWASTERWIWWGTLTDTVSKDGGAVPAAIRAGR
jgi:sortase A